MCLGPSPGATPLRLTATLEARGPAAAVLLTEEQVQRVAGAAKTPPVRVTVNGVTFSGRVGRMGGEILLGFNQAVRARTGVTPGDVVELEVALETEPPPLELPEELRTALAGDAVAHAAFAHLAPSRRKELARRVAEAKRPETRARRVLEALAELREARARRG